MEFVIIFLALILCYAFLRTIFSIFRHTKPNNLPPGPTPLPIIGNLHLLGDQPHQSLAKLAKIHGPVMILKLGQITTLVISSATAAKEVLKNQDVNFASRHVPDALTAHNHSQNSVVFLPVGNRWRTHRKILNLTIFSVNSLDANQHIISQKVKALVAYCQKASQSGDSVDIGRAAFRTSMNILSNTMFSKDLADPYEDSGKDFKEVVRNIMVESGKPNLVDFFPVLRKFDPQGIRKRMTQYFGMIYDIFEVLIKERVKMGTFERDDMLDKCLKISQEKPDEFDHLAIKDMFLDLFVAGTDSTSNSLEWAMTEVLRNPHTLAKVKEELEEVIGKENIVQESDLSKLPYLCCVVKETLRIHPPFPFLIPRKIETAVNLNGYTVPKDTQVLVNVWAIGRDPNMWEDSLEFKPERFLASTLDLRGKDFELIPFGAGRRLCPGLPLANHVLHVMLGSLLNNFDWNLDYETQPDQTIDMKEKFGIALQKAEPLCVIPVPLK
ncbi:7-ethoxycoumarin O-deethylase-like isoform X2 [Rutidosis leptorrhynchoides]|uniref:7-ethoxycoumarin O-deethylase-like isoform X2 n=1 Tax=Rutidosis leptorrhynchoides TaxID=125765 RepID=UPI003A99C398